MRIVAYQSESGNHLIDGDVESGPVYTWALFPLLAWEWFRHVREREREGGWEEGGEERTVVVGERVFE